MALHAPVIIDPEKSIRDQVLAERKQAPARLADWANAKDPLTRRINQIASINPRTLLLKGTAPESGAVDAFMSLTYRTPEIARQAFNDNNSYVYARNGVPRSTLLGEILRQFDPAAAAGRITNWGMGAVSSVLHALKAGDHVVASKNLFGTTWGLLNNLPEQGKQITFIDGTNPKNWEAAIRPNTKLFWFEPRGNPTLPRVDISAVSEIAHAKGRDILVAADNSLNFGALSPLALGADITASSLTKAFGFQRYGGGAVLMSQDGIERHQRQIGNNDSGTNQFFSSVAVLGHTLSSGIVARGLIENARHLPGRFDQQAKSAAALAQHLADLGGSSGITVIHPVLNGHKDRTSVFAVDLGSEQRAFAFIKQLGAVGIEQINNFGGPKTAITHPASTTHHSLNVQQQADQGITPGLLRVTVGIENAAVVVDAFENALRATNARRTATPRRTHLSPTR